MGIPSHFNSDAPLGNDSIYTTDLKTIGILPETLADISGCQNQEESNLSTVNSQQRVLSGMRPTGRLHLGHYHGVLQNWIKLQHEYECFFFVADWHALTTHYGDATLFEDNVIEMVIDWLAVGVNPGSAALFVQSKEPEHAELHLLLSMITPMGWLERVPSYKDQQQKLLEKELDTYGFLGYPLLQAADILIYRGGMCLWALTR